MGTSLILLSLAKFQEDIPLLSISMLSRKEIRTKVEGLRREVIMSRTSRDAAHLLFNLLSLVRLPWPRQWTAPSWTLVHFRATRVMIFFD